MFGPTTFEIDSYTLSMLRFDRRSNEPLVLTEEMLGNIEADKLEIETFGYIMAYETKSDIEVFSNYELKISDQNKLQTEQEFRDSELVDALLCLDISVDMDTFTALRSGMKMPKLTDEERWEAEADAYWGDYWDVPSNVDEATLEAQADAHWGDYWDILSLKQ
jgi:hypothetical protein